MAKTKTRIFQTETKQLLKLMIHSLYSNKEIFIRELVSNASDALDKLRFESVKNKKLSKFNKDLNIKIHINTEENTITISDNGIGMSEDEIVNNIGTIARSGTANFLENISGDKKKDSNLIGQFGVGFYSVFICFQGMVFICFSYGFYLVCISFMHVRLPYAMGHTQFAEHGK